MSNIINLNHKRKATAKVKKEKTAAENRVKFGRTKAQKSVEKSKAELLKKNQEGHKIDKD